MFPPLIITLRETLEASLVVGIVLAFLNRTGNEEHTSYAWWGVGAGIALSLLLAWVFSVFVGGFTGTAEYLYEGITMLSAAVLITWMVVWMAKQGRYMREGIENKVATHLEQNSLISIAILVFLSVAREGIETVLFLHAAFLQSDSSYHYVGAVLGIVVAIGVSMVFFKTMNGVSLRRFFTATTVLLLLFAAGLFAHGVHELQEASVIPILIEHVWDINPAVLVEGVYPLLHEKGAIGGIFKGVFGYNGNPSLIEVLSYALYLSVVGTWFWRSTKAN